MIGMGPGTWMYSSTSDPRWNGSGRVEVMAITSSVPQEAQDYLKAKMEELGELPEDLHIAMHKD